MMREVLPSTSPTTRLSCARTRSAAVPGLLNPSPRLSARPVHVVLRQCRSGRIEARYSELSLPPAQSRRRTPKQCHGHFEPLDRPRISPKLAFNWRVLGILNLYRVLVPLVLLSLYSLGGSRGIAVESPQLFFAVAIFYLCFGLFSVVLVRRRLASVRIQTILQATIDITSLMLLLHACGGITSGLGLLLLVPVGSLAFLLPPRSALFLAAVTAIAVLLHTIWLQLNGHADINAYATAGFLGVVLFTVAASASVLATRMRESEELVRQKDVDLANLADLSQYIVQHLRESLLVVDAADKIRLINESAAEILGDTHAVPGALVGEVSPRLLYSLTTWRQGERDGRCAVDLRGRRRRTRDSTAFRPARHGTGPDPDFPRRHESPGRARAAEQARGPRPAVRQHRA